MSVEQQNALLQEQLDLSHTYRQQAALRNGIPNMPERNRITTPSPAPVPVAAPVQQAPPSVPIYLPAPTEPKWSMLKKLGVGLGLAAATAGTGGLGAFAVQHLLQEKPQETPAPVETPSGDLLPWLSKEGYNLPPSEAAK